MSAPLAYDLTPAFDPTGYPSISGSQLYQLISGIVPNADAGFIKVTTDVAGVPEVPDATTTTKWQNYIWVRIQAASVAAYVWNPNAATHATYLKWQTMVEASIADLSITTAKLAAGAVTDDKVTSVSVGKITGLAGTYIPSGSAAGGDLSGTYPNPTIGANAVTGSKLSSSASVDASRAVGTDHIKDDAVTEPKIAADAVQTAQIKDGNVTTAKLVQTIIYDTATKAAPTVADYVLISDSADSNKIKKALLSTPPGIIQRVVKRVSGAANTTTILPYDTSVPQVGEGAEYASVSFTPKSASSILRITFNAWGVSTAGNLVLALFSDASANALAATAAYDNTTNKGNNVSIDYSYASPGTSAITFSVRFGPGSAGTARLNSDATGAIFGAAAVSCLTIEEFNGTLS